MQYEDVKFESSTDTLLDCEGYRYFFPMGNCYKGLCVDKACEDTYIAWDQSIE